VYGSTSREAARSRIVSPAGRFDRGLVHCTVVEPMARLTSVHGAFGAHVLAARLQAEGFDVELRGGLHNPYALTVGDLAVVDVWVPADQVDDASYVLLVNEVDAVLDDDGPRRRRVTPAVRVVAGGLIVVALASAAVATF
jgi:hypothetical protein